jgi:hypothetical protein
VDQIILRHTKYHVAWDWASDGQATTIVIENRRWVPMPARVTITLESGETLRFPDIERENNTWEAGGRSGYLVAESGETLKPFLPGNRLVD